MLRDAHTVGDRAAIGAGVEAGRFADLISRDPGDGFGPFRGALRDTGLEGLESFGAILDERLIGQPFGNDHIDHGVEECHVRARALADVQRGKACQVDASRIGDDERGAVIDHGGDNTHGRDGMGLGGVGAGHEDAVGVFEIGLRVGHRAGAEGARQPGYGRGVAQPRAVIDIVGAHRGAEEFLKDIVLFVGAFRR